MTARRLWLLLALLAPPLVIAATTGCNLIFKLDETRPIFQNKLSCDCTCNPTTPDPVVSLRVVAPSDDAEQDGAGMLLDSAALDLGQLEVGLRFERLTIPHRASITRAVVRFTASADDTATTNLKILFEQNVAPLTFTNADNDLTGRTYGTPLDWTAVPAWTSGDSSNAQETPELKDMLQALVDDDDWNDASSLVVRFQPVTGHRRALTRQTATSRAALLEVEYTTGVTATLPICASADAEIVNSSLTEAGQASECSRLESTLEGLAVPCGYPPECTCTPSTTIPPSDSGECSTPCAEVPVDASCSNFDPNAFERCLQQPGETVASCKRFVTATNAAGGSPVCVPSGSALAFHAFGSRSLCMVEGTSHIQVGEAEPKHDPATTGTVEFLAQPCPAGGCKVQPYFDLRMEPITFSVKWHSDPTFIDLTASGRGLDAAAYGGGELSYAPDGIAGTGNGRRTTDVVTHNANLALDATNSQPLDFGIDWGARRCDMVGSVAGATGDDGLCDGDGTTPCRFDSPDCDVAGGPCNLPPDPEGMSVDVVLAGDLVNQPPKAVAGPDQHVECTSSAGASFALDGRGSSDPDQNLALASWREGSRVGNLIVNGLNAELALGLGQSKSYVLRVVDAYAQTDEDTTAVSVVDTTPPTIACNAPATLSPANNRPIVFTATATDTCTDSVAAQLVDFECFKLNGHGDRIDKTKSCKVTLSGATIAISPPQGVGQHIAWTARAVDGSGNVREVVCEIEVVKKK